MKKIIKINDDCCNFYNNVSIFSNSLKIVNIFSKLKKNTSNEFKDSSLLQKNKRFDFKILLKITDYSRYRLLQMNNWFIIFFTYICSWQQLKGKPSKVFRFDPRTCKLHFCKTIVEIIDYYYCMACLRSLNDSWIKQIALKLKWNNQNDSRR